MSRVLRVGVDAHFAASSIRAGLFVHHRELFHALVAEQKCTIRLFLDQWSVPEAVADATRAGVQQAFELPTHLVRLPGRLATLRMPFSPFRGIDVFYHVFGGRLGVVPSRPNVFLVPDLIPLHIDYPVEGMRSSAAAYYQSAVDHGRAIIVYSEHTKAELVATFGAQPSRIVVTPLAAGAAFRPPDAEALASFLHAEGLSRPYILAVGTLEPRKNLALLVHAFARLKRQSGLPHQLVLCGAKWVGYEDIFAAIESEGLGDAVRVLDRVERVDLLYGGAGVLAFPSKYEGFGLPPLEAMQCGTPVVAARATSVPEVVGDAALLFDPDSEDDLAGALGQVLTDAHLARRLSEAGLSRAAQFSWRETARLTRQAFDMAAGRRDR